MLKDSKAIFDRVNGYKSLKFPEAATHRFLTIDCQSDSLCWMMTDFGDDFTASISAINKLKVGACFWGSDRSGGAVESLLTFTEAVCEVIDNLSRTQSIDAVAINGDGQSRREIADAVLAQRKASLEHIFSVKFGLQPDRELQQGERGGPFWLVPHGQQTLYVDANAIIQLIHNGLNKTLGEAGSWSVADLGYEQLTQLGLSISDFTQEYKEHRGQQRVQWYRQPRAERDGFDRCIFLAGALALMVGSGPLARYPGNVRDLEATYEALGEINSDTADAFKEQCEGGRWVQTASGDVFDFSDVICLHNQEIYLRSGPAIALTGDECSVLRECLLKT